MSNTDLPTANYQKLAPGEIVRVFLEHGIEVFDFGLEVCSRKPKEDEARVDQSLLEDQLAEISVGNEQNAFFVPSDRQDVLIGRSQITTRLTPAMVWGGPPKRVPRGEKLMPTTASGTKAKSKAKANSSPGALQRPLQPSEELAVVVGATPLSRGEVVSKVWDYIKSHNLQNPENRREILSDDNLKRVFGKDRVTMFEMNKYLAQHLK